MRKYRLVATRDEAHDLTILWSVGQFSDDHLQGWIDHCHMYEIGKYVLTATSKGGEITTEWTPDEFTFERLKKAMNPSAQIEEIKGPGVIDMQRWQFTVIHVRDHTPPRWHLPRICVSFKDGIYLQTGWWDTAHSISVKKTK